MKPALRRTPPRSRAILAFVSRVRRSTCDRVLFAAPIRHEGHTGHKGKPNNSYLCVLGVLCVELNPRYEELHPALAQFWLPCRAFDDQRSCLRAEGATASLAVARGRLRRAEAGDRGTRRKSYFSAGSASPAFDVVSTPKSKALAGC